MPQLDAYLMFDGNCAEAMRSYQSTLGGKLDVMTHAQSPIAAQTPPGMADRVMRFGMLVDRFETPWMVNGGMQGGA